MSEVVVAEFQRLTSRLADDAERKCLRLLAAYEAGQLSGEDLMIWLAVEIGRANAGAYGVADSTVSAQLEAATGQPVPLVGIGAPDDDTDRLVQAVTTLLSDPVDLSMRVARLARAEPYAAAQHAAVAAMGQHEMVEGWTRQMDGDPCELCRWWWREGRVWPKAHPFQRHTGCNCQPRIVLRQDIQSTGYTRRIERDG